MQIRARLLKRFFKFGDNLGLLKRLDWQQRI
jgi:hypothetical protein